MKIAVALLFVLISLTSSFGETEDPFFWDFGMVKKNTVVRHDFLIRNSLDRKLTIKDITTSCGCTASEAGKKVLDPAETTEITVSFNSKGYKGETQQFVYVATDDPVNPVYKYTFKAYVE